MMDKKTLNVGFDAKRAVANATGLGNYSRRVIDEIASLHPSWRLNLYAPALRNPALVMPLLAHPGATLRLPSAIWRPASSLWRVAGGLTSDLSRDKIDIYHGLSNEIPLDIRRARIPSVVTIHDVIYRRLPDNYKPLDRKIYDFKYGQSARNATRIIAISRQTADDIVSFYNVDPSKIDIIYQSCDPQFSAPITTEQRTLLRQTCPELPPRFIAMVGTVEPRKNQLLAVRALPSINPEVHLVIVGHHRRGYGQQILREVTRLGLSSRVLMLDSFPFPLLPALYSEAELAAYVSRYEGFGLPVVEALSAGTPVIAATGSCLEEAGGPGAIYVDPDDVDGFAAAANSLLADPALRADLVADGRQHIALTLSTPMGVAVSETYRRAISSL